MAVKTFALDSEQVALILQYLNRRSSDLVSDIKCINESEANNEELVVWIELQSEKAELAVLERIIDTLEYWTKQTLERDSLCKSAVYFTVYSKV